LIKGKRSCTGGEVRAIKQPSKQVRTGGSLFLSKSVLLSDPLVTLISGVLFLEVAFCNRKEQQAGKQAEAAVEQASTSVLKKIPESRLAYGETPSGIG
jgi:hypothetical protein